MMMIAFFAVALLSQGVMSAPGLLLGKLGFHKELDIGFTKANGHSFGLHREKDIGMPHGVGVVQQPTIIRERPTIVEQEVIRQPVIRQPVIQEEIIQRPTIIENQVIQSRPAIVEQEVIQTRPTISTMQYQRPATIVQEEQYVTNVQRGPEFTDERIIKGQTRVVEEEHEEVVDQIKQTVIEEKIPKIIKTKTPTYYQETMKQQVIHEQVPEMVQQQHTEYVTETKPIYVTETKPVTVTENKMVMKDRERVVNVPGETIITKGPSRVTEETGQASYNVVDEHIVGSTRYGQERLSGSSMYGEQMVGGSTRNRLGLSPSIGNAPYDPSIPENVEYYSDSQVYQPDLSYTPRIVDSEEFFNTYDDSEERDYKDAEAPRPESDENWTDSTDELTPPIAFIPLANSDGTALHEDFTEEDAFSEPELEEKQTDYSDYPIEPDRLLTDNSAHVGQPFSPQFSDEEYPEIINSMTEEAELHQEKPVVDEPTPLLTFYKNPLSNNELPNDDINTFTVSNETPFALHQKEISTAELKTNAPETMKSNMVISSTEVTTTLAPTNNVDNLATAVSPSAKTELEIDKQATTPAVGTELTPTAYPMSQQSTVQLPLPNSVNLVTFSDKELEENHAIVKKQRDLFRPLKISAKPRLYKKLYRMKQKNNETTYTVVVTAPTENFLALGNQTYNPKLTYEIRREIMVPQANKSFRSLDDPADEKSESNEVEPEQQPELEQPAQEPVPSAAENDNNSVENGNEDDDKELKHISRSPLVWWDSGASLDHLIHGYNFYKRHSY